ncbi:MAG: hypothetical protein VX438_00190, partial [Planctomycetota bacterium]|nr:hypothetical protein [Planctomycetota bacterium]
CRHHYFREGFLIALNRLNEMTRDEFVNHGKVKALYSLSGAYCQFLMRQKKIRKEFLAFLKLVHQGKNATVALKRIGQQVSFEKDFIAFLKPSKKKLENSLLDTGSYRILYLGHSDIDDSILGLLENADQLESLDLSQTRVTSSGIEKLSGLHKLKYLSLEKTGVTDSCMAGIARLESLEELDLKTTAITDRGLGEIDGLQNLVALWMGGTRVSDRSLNFLLKLGSLKQLDIRKTAISDSGSVKLKQKLQLVE